MTIDIIARVPFALTARTITFYARGRQWSLPATSPEFANLRAALQRPGQHDIDELVALCDVRQGLLRRSQGQLVLDEDNDTIVWRGQVLHNVWVEKILDYRSAGEPFEPIWNALQRLVKNPTQAAIDRLPVFLERTALGFLPDGRFLAFKGVDPEFYSCHQAVDGSRFRHLVGDICQMPRDQVDADPDQTCSTGLHVGAPGYVKQHYSGASFQLVLVAVAPEDVVAVPVDYNGEKMRVCGYEVIAHLDQAYNDELLGSLRTTQSHGYGVVEEDQEDQDEPYKTVKVGDVIAYEESYEIYGRVVEIDDNDADNPIRIMNVLGRTEWITDTSFNKIIEPGDVTGAMVAYEGAQVYVVGHSTIRDGEYLIMGLVDEDNPSHQDDGDASTFEVGEHRIPVTNGCIQRVTALDGTVIFPRPTRPEVGDFVDIGANGHPPAGRYPVAEVCPTGVIVQTEYDGLVFVNDSRLS